MNAPPTLLPSVALGITLMLGPVPGHAQSFAPIGIASDRPAARTHHGGYFTESQRRAIASYYTAHLKASPCPSRAAVAPDACGARDAPRPWRMGRALPQDLTPHPVNDDVSLRLGLPPEGHRFVRVGSDILLVSVGTGIVIDAIEHTP